MDLFALIASLGGCLGCGVALVCVLWAIAQRGRD